MSKFKVFTDLEINAIHIDADSFEILEGNGRLVFRKGETTTDLFEKGVWKAVKLVREEES